MLSSVLSLKPQNTTTSLLFSKNSTGSKYLNESNTKQYHSPIMPFNPPTPPLSVSSSRSNLLVQRVPLPPYITLLRPSVTSSLKFADRSIAIAVPSLWNKLPPTLRQLSYELAKTSPLSIFPQLFYSKLKTLLFNKSYPDLSSPPTSLPVSTPNTIHHSRLTVCLPDFLDLTRCLSIFFG